MNTKEKNIAEIDLNAIVAHLSDSIAFTRQILKELPPSDKASSVGAVIRSDIESLIDILTVGSIGGEDFRHNPAFAQLLSLCGRADTLGGTGEITDSKDFLTALAAKADYGHLISPERECTVRLNDIEQLVVLKAHDFGIENLSEDERHELYRIITALKYCINP